MQPNLRMVYTDFKRVKKNSRTKRIIILVKTQFLLRHTFTLKRNKAKY